ncbi:STAS domain-containing protein [candidate division KSB1 bacterium]|nr:STAS domain-containing protein [candidate division KSB1 bacterium]
MAGETVFLLNKQKLLSPMLLKTLEAEGYVVKAIHDYKQLKLVSGQITPNLLIMEVVSVMDDIQAFKDNLERMPYLKDVPLIAMLDSISRNHAVLMARMGFFEILVNPIKQENFMKTVKKAISRMKKDGEFRLIDGESEDGFRIVEFLTQLDASNSKNVENYIDHLIIDREFKKIIFDFKQVQYIDSSGIGVLIVCKKKLDLLGGDLRIVHVNDQVRSLLETLHIDKILGIGKEETA